MHSARVLRDMGAVPKVSAFRELPEAVKADPPP